MEHERVGKNISVIFQEIGYEKLKFVINTDNAYIDFTLYEKTIAEIEDILFRFYEAYDIDRNNVSYYTCSENYNKINQKTLSNTKTVWELFEAKGITIREM